MPKRKMTLKMLEQNGARPNLEEKNDYISKM